MNTKNENKLISVIIPFYKEVDLIGMAVESVVMQQLPSNYSLEIVVGNDSELSEEQLYECIPQHIKAITKIAKNTNAKGAGNARNAALGCSVGDVIAFLDADDLWCSEEKLKTQISLIQKGAKFVVSGYRNNFNGKELIPFDVINSAHEVLGRSLEGPRG